LLIFKNKESKCEVRPIGAAFLWRVNEQPTSLKVIAGINILASVSGFLSVFYILWDGWRTLGYVVPGAILYLIFAFVVSFLVFLSSLVMLEGKSWGRTLYIFIGCLSVAVGFIDGRYADKDAIRSLIKLCILGFFLYRPIINEYFKSSKIENVQNN